MLQSCTKYSESLSAEWFIEPGQTRQQIIACIAAEELFHLYHFKSILPLIKQFILQDKEGITNVITWEFSNNYCLAKSLSGYPVILI